MHQKITPDPFLILVNNPKQPLHERNSVILLQIRYFERELLKSFKKVNLIFLYNGMSLYVTLMSFVCHSYVLVCHSYVTLLYSYVIRMSLVCTRMSFVCHLLVLVCHSYVTRMYSYVICMSLVCTRMSSVCHSYVLICHLYVTRMWFYHEPFKIPLINKPTKVLEQTQLQLTIFLLTLS